MLASLQSDIVNLVARAIQEDVGAQDASACLIPKDNLARAQIKTRQAAILCGIPYATEVFTQVDSTIKVTWHAQDGDKIQRDQIFCTLEGPARSILTAERTALNFLQTLSGTATRTAYFVDLIKNTKTVLLDTRKTIPGLRAAQKYAVRMGGGTNHRQGLFDAVLIKENHIIACGSITAAIQSHQTQQPHIRLMIEVENIDELHEAITAGATHILCDNFSHAMLQEAVALKPSLVKIEASGGITAQNILMIAKTGVDYISLGTLTKDVEAVDLSLLFFSHPR